MPRKSKVKSSPVESSKNDVDARKKKRAPRKIHKKVNDFYPAEMRTDDASVRITKSGSQVYNPKIHPHAAYMLGREHGFTRAQMARVFGVSETTVKSWMEKYDDFYEKMLQGRDEFDRYHVEQMLLKRAMGFEYKEITKKRIHVRGKDLDGAQVLIPGEETTETTRYTPPDVKAATFWLTNRNPDRWQMVHKIQAEVNNTQKKITANTADLAKMSVEQLKTLRDLISTSANGEGAAIPIECVEQDTDSETKMIEDLVGRAEEIAEAEYEEVEEEENQ